MIALAAFAVLLAIHFATDSVSAAEPQEPTWTQLGSVGAPTQLKEASMVYDAASEEVVLFGGWRSGTASDETWTYDDGEWTERHPANSPSPRSTAAIAYDPASEEVVLFGGWDHRYAVLGDTWTYADGEWTQLHPEHSPSPRVAAAMTYDPTLGAVILFGGRGETSTGNDTWTYADGEWTQLYPEHSPPATYFGALAPYPPADQLLLFGGYGLGASTWLFDGTDWTEAHPTNSPSPRTLLGTAYDAALGEVVLFGGYLLDSPQPSDETWTYADGEWTERQPANSPSPRVAPIAYDDKSGQVIVFGGSDGTNFWSDTWALDPPATEPTDGKEPSQEGQLNAVTQSAAAKLSPLRLRLTYSPNKPHRADPSRGPRWTFRFTAPGARFRCRLDSGAFKPCSSPKVYRGLAAGRHVFRVYAADASGRRTPARVIRFRVGRAAR